MKKYNHFTYDEGAKEVCWYPRREPESFAVHLFGITSVEQATSTPNRWILRLGEKPVAFFWETEKEELK